MSDLIKRDVAIASSVRAAIDWHRLANPQYSIAYCIGKALNGLPAVDAVEVKHGEWEKRMNIGVLTWCSECGWMKHQEDERKYNYCPNCGARMDGGNDVQEK